jgi:acyl-coenzyme A synthetase/AMP-(fatty) acid ligase
MASRPIFTASSCCQTDEPLVIVFVFQECGITGRKYSYDQVRLLTRRFGSSLVRMGFKRGEVLGLVLPNIPEFPIALLGGAGIGMPVTTVNPIYTAGAYFLPFSLNPRVLCNTGLRAIRMLMILFMNYFYF